MSRTETRSHGGVGGIYGSAGGLPVPLGHERDRSLNGGPPCSALSPLWQMVNPSELCIVSA